MSVFDMFKVLAGRTVNSEGSLSSGAGCLNVSLIYKGVISVVLAGHLGGGGVILGRVLLELFDPTDGFGLAAAVLGVEVQYIFMVVIFDSLFGVVEDVLLFVANGVGEVRVNGRVGGVVGWGKGGYGGWCGWEGGMISGRSGVDGWGGTCDGQYGGFGDRC